MAAQLYTKALTTQSRVKARLGITVSTFDTVFISLINSLTDWIEGECNRQFLSQTYTNQVYSVEERGMKFLSLEQSPVTTLTSLEYRAGTPSSPSWTAFIADQYELVGSGKSGMIRVYGDLPHGTNAVRATYVAGYLFDFTNYGSATHTLPADLTELCERMVVKAFKQRDSKGKTTESFEGATVTWSTVLDEDEKSILARYKRLPAFV
jgi:hypothetical protein